MPRILHLRSSAEVLGAERVVLELCKNLPKHGFDSVVGIPIGPNGLGSSFSDLAREEGVSVVEFPISGAYDLRVLQDIRAYVKAHRISIVHSHGYREDLYALACGKQARLVATNHLWKRTTWRLRRYAQFDALLLKRFSRVVAVSVDIAEEMRSCGISHDRISTISNGVDMRSLANLEHHNLRSELGLDAKNVVLGTVSSLTSEKALHNAISAFEACHSTNELLRLLIVGDGPELRKLQDLATELGVAAHVIFAGRRSDVAEVYATLDIFLLPSLIEGLPMAMLEAMASGLPVIVSAVGDVSNVVDASVGELVQPDDKNALIDAISRLSSDDILRTTLGQNAKFIIAEHHSSRAMTSKYVDLYNQLILDNENKP